MESGKVKNVNKQRRKNLPESEFGLLGLMKETQSGGEIHLSFRGDTL